MRVSSGFLTVFSNVCAEALIRWHFRFSLVFVVIIHIHSDTGLKVTFVFSVVITPSPRIDFAPLPELYKQTFLPSDEVNLCKPVSLIRVSCTIIAGRRNL